MLNTKMWKKMFGLLCAVVFVLASCASKEEEPPKVDMNTPFVLKVGAGNLTRFMEDYYGLLLERFPQMQIEVVQANDFIDGDIQQGEKLEEALERQYQTYLKTEQPDVLMYSTLGVHRVLIDAGMIEPLDALIKRDQYDVDTMYKPAMDKLKAYGGGQLYGLAPFFIPGYVTYINHDLFNQMGVPVPQAPYTWNDLIEVGGRFAGLSSGDEPVTGFAYGCASASTTGQLVLEIGRSQKLALFNDKLEMTFQSDSWKKALEPLSKAIRSGAYQVPAADAYDNCSLTMKNTAIVVSWADKANLLQQMTSEEHPVNIQMNVPPSPVYGPQFGNAQPQEIFSIVKGSPVADQAWEVIKAINDVTMVTKLASIAESNPLLPMREGVPYQYNGSSLDQFYSQKEFDPDDIYVSKEISFARSYLYGMITQQFAAMQNEGRSLDETMSVIQQKGNEILTAYKAEGIKL